MREREKERARREGKKSHVIFNPNLPAGRKTRKRRKRDGNFASAASLLFLPRVRVGFACTHSPSTSR